MRYAAAATYLKRLGALVHVRQTLARLATNVLASLLSLAFCVAGVVVAFTASISLFGLTPGQLRQPASLSWLFVFLLLFLVFSTVFVTTAYGLVVFLLHRFSATHLLSLVGPAPSDSGLLSRVFAHVHSVGKRLGSRGAP